MDTEESNDDQIQSYMFGNDNTFIRRNKFENKIYDYAPPSIKKKLNNSDNVITFRLWCYRLLILLVLVTAFFVVILYNLGYIKFFFMNNILQSNDSWLYHPNIDSLEVRASQTSSKYELQKITTIEGLRYLRKQSLYISDQVLIDMNIPNENITFHSVFTAHERLMKSNNLECVCSPMYGLKYRFMSFITTNNMIVHTLNPKLTGPPSSVDRMNYAKSKIPKASTTEDNDIRLLDSEYFIIPQERKNTAMKHLKTDEVLTGSEKPSYSLVTFDPYIDISKIEIYNTDTVTIVFPSYVTIDFITWKHQYHPDDRKKLSTRTVDDKSSACVETCLLLFEGISPFDISFHE